MTSAIAAGGSPSPVSAHERLLVQLVTLTTLGQPREQRLYRSIEWGAERLAAWVVRRGYRGRVLLHGSDATADALVDSLSAATAEPGVKAVDLLLNPHGTTQRLWLAEGPIDATDLARRLQHTLDAGQRRRLRAAFSTACFGMAHTDAWLRSGFAVAVGARGVYADGLTSLPLLMRAWGSGATVQRAVGRANNERTRNRQDLLAARYYERIGRLSDAMAVDSERVVDGAATMTISTDPAQWRPTALPG